MSIEDDLRAQLECAKSDVAELRQQIAAAEARIKELGEERQPIADVIAGLLNVYLRYEDSIDPDYETVEAINRGKAALEALRKDWGTDVVPSSTGAKC